MLDLQTQEFTKRLLKEYYSKASADDIAPPHAKSREYGFGDFEKKISFRHKAFASANELKKYIVDNAPAFISYSSAEYESPDARPMENKGWLGSELIFDLDATDLHLECQKQHGRSWVCDNCLDSVKSETVRLVEDFLMPDFGFPEKEIKINFSGNRGYHVHVLNNEVFRLDSKERRSISEYISATGIDMASFFPNIGERGKALHGPKPSDAGWGGKFARGMVSALNEQKSLEALNIDSAIAKKLHKNRADIVLGISTGNWDKVNIPKKVEFWNNVIKNMSIAQSDSIDRNVTNDIHHLIRLPNTIHGDTGLVGTRIDNVSELEKFDPMKESIAFKHGTVKVRISKAPKFQIGGSQYGPYENTDVELPTYAAMYLLLKRLATIAN